jgi:hypothetical protein
MNQDSQIILRVTGDQRLAEEWELVLLAKGLSPSLQRSPDGVVLSVPEAEVDRALASLAAYERENPRKLAERAEPMESGSLLAGVTVALMLLRLFFVTVQWLRANLPGVTVSTDLVGWQQGQSWVQVVRVDGQMVWPYAHDEAGLDVEVRAPNRDGLAALKVGARDAMLQMTLVPVVAGATVNNVVEENVFDLPASPDEGLRSICSYRLLLRAA